MLHYTRQRKGYVLILVLGSIVLLSSIALLFSLKTTEKIKVTAEQNTQELLLQNAYSALEISLGIINEFGIKDRALWGPQQGWRKPLEDFQGEFPQGMLIDVTCSDECAKIPLNNAQQKLLMLGLNKLNTSMTEQDQLNDALLDWMDEDNLRRLHGFDGDDYRTQQLHYISPNRSLHNWRELNFIHTWDTLAPQIKKHFTEIFSLFNPRKVNINSASNEVIEILEEFTATDLTVLKNIRAGDDLILGTSDDNIIKELTPYSKLKNNRLIGLSTDIIYIKIEARYANTNVLLHALVKWDGGSIPDAITPPKDLAYPFTIIRLEENTHSFSPVEL